MRHTPFASLDELLAPETLSRLVGSPIVSARRLPLAGGDSASGSRFFAMETNDGQARALWSSCSLPVGLDRAWHRGLPRAGGTRLDERLLDRLPPEITHPVIACARDGEGWAILMHDVSAPTHPGSAGCSRPSLRPTTGATSTRWPRYMRFWGQSETGTLRLATAVHGPVHGVLSGDRRARGSSGRTKTFAGSGKAGPCLAQITPDRGGAPAPAAR